MNIDTEQLVAMNALRFIILTKFNDALTGARLDSAMTKKKTEDKREKNNHLLKHFSYMTHPIPFRV